MAGLLDYASSVAGEAKKNVQGLLADPKQALKDVLNNLTSKAAASQAKTKAAWATRDPKIMAQNALDSSQTALGFAPLGITAWHGSPHKFDKFDMSKIGTGEGAQAYGHGLYLAEHPATAEVYASKLANGGAMPMPPTPKDFMVDGSRYVRQEGALFKQVGDSADLLPVGKEEYGVSLRKAQQVYEDKLKAGNLYKTDIPDEAVARFLDWDKPLSQQAPEVQAALQKAAEMRARQTGNGFGKLDPEAIGRTMVPTLGEGRLQQAGIPGIRYLDGGSRSVGQGSSNFVAFDPDLIRILERNGQATGNTPWQPGEWRGLLGK